MPYCLNCGKEIPPGAKFCGNCGAAAQAPPSASPNVTTPSPPLPSAPTPPAQTARTDNRPEGIRLFVTIDLVVSILMIAFGALFVLLSAEGAGLGAFFIIVGGATFVPRYGYSNAKPWGIRAGTAKGVVYALLGLLFTVASISPLDVISLVLGVLGIAYGALNIYYLTKPVPKAYFYVRR